MKTEKEARTVLFHAVTDIEPTPTQAEIEQAIADLEHNPAWQSSVDELLEVIGADAEDEPEFYREQLLAYIEAQLDGREQAAEFAEIRRRLDMNVIPAEEYTLLYDLLVAERTHTLPMVVPRKIPNITTLTPSSEPSLTRRLPKSILQQLRSLALSPSALLMLGALGVIFLTFWLSEQTIVNKALFTTLFTLFCIGLGWFFAGKSIRTAFQPAFGRLAYGVISSVCTVALVVGVYRLLFVGALPVNQESPMLGKPSVPPSPLALPVILPSSNRPHLPNDNCQALPIASDETAFASLAADELHIYQIDNFDSTGLETKLRLLLIEYGQSEPEIQLTVFDDCRQDGSLKSERNIKQITSQTIDLVPNLPAASRLFEVDLEGSESPIYVRIDGAQQIVGYILRNQGSESK